MEKRLLIGSWLFLIGSSLFLVEAIAQLSQDLSWLSWFHVSEGALFLVGSIFFMPEPQKDDSKVLD